MKKIFIISLFIIIMIFGIRIAFSGVGLVCLPDGSCTCPENYPYLDTDIVGDEKCIGEFELSQRDSVNMRGIKIASEEFKEIKNNIIPSFINLNNELKDTLITKLNLYYLDNYNISTSTIENITRSSRDSFFRDKHVSQLGLSRTFNIFWQYNILGSSIQNLISLLNTTKLYIIDSDLDTDKFISDISSAESLLQGYINSVNLDINVLSNSINGFVINNPDSFTNFIDSYSYNRSILNTRRDQYYAVRDEIRNLAISAVQAVEAAYNKYSSISANPDKIYASGGPVLLETGYFSEVNVIVKDSLNNPIPNRLISFEFSKSSPPTTVVPVNEYTDEQGIARFNFMAANVGFIGVVAKIQGEDIAIIFGYLIEVLENPIIESCEKGGGTWNGWMCDCPKGFVWDEKELKCVVSESGGITEEICINGGGSWDEVKKECNCLSGYYWDQDTLRCLISESGGITEAVCRAGGGEWDRDEGECFCLPGYYFDPIQLQCVRD